jgi:hypothetical protein
MTRIMTVVGALLALAAILTSAKPANATRDEADSRFVIYSVATAEQFVNNEDDRARGLGNNPFGNFKDKVAVVEKGTNGPFAGDEVVFQFALYRHQSSADLIGTATFTCNYYFDKAAFCQAVYNIGKSQIFANGAFPFNTKQFSLTLSGGSGQYTDVSGVVSTSPAAQHMQRLSFLTG